MKIVHTADWHLGDRLGRLDRTADLRERVERVADYCEEHAADLLLVAGDLFYEKISVAAMADALAHVHGSFERFFARGGTILAVTGNHDDDSKINLVRAGSFLASPAKSGGVFARGRMYVQNGLAFGRFESAAGERVQCVLVPYPRAVRYELDDGYRTREEEHRRLQDKLTRWTADVFTKATFDTSLPTILVAHLHVRGANIGRTLFRVSEMDDVLIDPAILKSGWAYVALGHIHAPQAVDGVSSVRYPGPLDRLDLGEMADDRGVLLVDIGPDGLRGEPVWLPLPPTPMADLTVADPDAELPTLAEQQSDRATAIVRIEVDATRSAHSRDEIARRLKQTFPRLHQLTWVGDTAVSPTAAAVDPASPGRPFADTVRTYLADQLAADPDRDAVLALADQYLATPEVPA